MIMHYSQARRAKLIAALLVIFFCNWSTRFAVCQSRKYINGCDNVLAWDSFYYKGTGGQGMFRVFNTGGNPFGYVQTVMTYPPSGASLGIFLWSPFIYTPSAEGPIASVDLGQSRATNNSTGWAMNFLQYVFTLRQANKTYMFYTAAPATPNAWQSQMFFDFTAARFWEQDELTGAILWDSHPDFTTAGGPIQFGYHLGAATAGYDYVQCLDNYAITINIGVPNIVVNGGFEHELVGWTVVKGGESGVYVTEAGNGSRACYLGAGYESIPHSGDFAIIEQNLPPVRTDDVTGFGWKYRSIGQTAEQPRCELHFDDGSMQVFGGGTSDGQWGSTSYAGRLPSGKILKKISMTASGGLLRIVGFLDDIYITVSGNAQRSNVLGNSGFEFATKNVQTGQTDFSGWDEDPANSAAGPETSLYADSNFLSGPSNRGSAANASYVTGGTSAHSSLKQKSLTIQRSASDVDSGKVSCLFSGWLGGHGRERDFAQAVLKFLSADGLEIGSVDLGTCGPAERANLSKLIYFQRKQIVPLGTRKLEISVDFSKFEGSTSDGCVDDLGVSFVDNTSQVRGQLMVAGYKGNISGLDVSADFYNSITHELVGTSRMSQNSSGNYVVESPLGPGIYDIAVRTKGSLVTRINAVGISYNAGITLPIALTLGDVDEDNYVGTDDYLILNDSFGLASVDPEYDARADLDGDAQVSTDDYLLINSSFDSYGE